MPVLILVPVTVWDDGSIAVGAPIEALRSGDVSAAIPYEAAPGIRRGVLRAAGTSTRVAPAWSVDAMVETLIAHPGSTVDDLSKASGLTNQTMRRRLGTLIEQGLVEAERDATVRGAPWRYWPVKMEEEAAVETA